jgi:hypothetical protein
MGIATRNHDGGVHAFVSPFAELNAGLWSLFLGATIFLGLRLWCKVTRRYGLWYDDYILLLSWVCFGFYWKPKFLPRLKYMISA